MNADDFKVDDKEDEGITISCPDWEPLGDIHTKGDVIIANDGERYKCVGVFKGGKYEH